MKIGEIRQALFEVKKFCERSACCMCPLHKHDGAVVYCPLNVGCEKENDPNKCEIEDWGEIGNSETNADNGWISVKDKLPLTEEEVLIYTSFDFCDVGRYKNGVWGSEFINEYEDGTVTHWQPLPKPPKERKQ